jgi:hypothetical protein
MAAEWSRSGVREVCEEIAGQAIEEAVDTMYNMCGNPGQSSITEQLANSAADAFSDISNGTYGGGLDCNHPEAVEIISQAGEEILSAASERCADIRDAANGHDGDLS